MQKQSSSRMSWLRRMLDSNTKSFKATLDQAVRKDAERMRAWLCRVRCFQRGMVLVVTAAVKGFSCMFPASWTTEPWLSNILLLLTMPRGAGWTSAHIRTRCVPMSQPRSLGVWISQCCVPVLQSLKWMGSTTGERLGEKKQQTVATWPFLGGYFAVWPWSIFHWWLCPLPAFWRNGSGACVPLHPARP